MIAVLTGDIINSQSRPDGQWLIRLKDRLEGWSSAPESWEIYRGDEFQLKCAPEEVFLKALTLKALLKTYEDLDVRLAIGLGEENFSSARITESNGSAYVNSGRLLTALKTEGRTLAIQTDDKEITADLNVILKWASVDFDRWTVATAEIIFLLLSSPELTQESLARHLNISQSSVSQRLKRANFDLITETDLYFRKKIATVTP